jgi:pyruvate formate lyase activating enzyme
VAKACRKRNIKSVAVTAGYISPEPRKEFFQYMDAANVDLKGFTEDFYWKVTGSHLAPILETIEYIHHETDVWMELTTLLIPGYNDSEKEIDEMTQWVVDKLGPDVPMHFTAFHPDYKLMDAPRTPLATLKRSRDIAMRNGVRYAFTGNVHDKEGDSTYCHSCGTRLIERDWYELGEWNLDANGCCKQCGTRCAGVFEAGHGDWGSKRQPVRLANYR